MARLRKAARLWRRPEMRDAAARVLIGAGADYFAIDPEKIFGRRAPLEIELGSGRGDFIIEHAATHPDRDFLAVELSGVVARLLASRCGRAELPNLRVARMDARPLVALMMAPGSVAAFHIYFPDPWPKERHHKHRMLTPRIADGVARALEPGGQVAVASDVREWAEEMFAMLRGAGLCAIGEPPPGASKTGFALKYVAAGKPIHAATFMRS